LTIVGEACAVTGGVDTHADGHMAAALGRIGGLLGVQEFPAAPDGYSRLLAWLRGFGTVQLAGIGGTGSYGAGLARHVAAAGIGVAGAGRSDRQDRRRKGKSGPLDAVSAARAAQSGRASGAPRGRDGTGGGDPGADGRQAHRPRRADPDDQPGPGTDPDRPGRHPDQVHPPLLTHPTASRRNSGTSLQPSPTRPRPAVCHPTHIPRPAAHRRTQ
jgi:hypothetical protein